MIKIINFHEINTDMEIYWFERVLSYLKHTKNLISCDDLNRYFDGGKLVKNSFLLTVDDGHISFYKNIYPLIKKHDVPITLFVSPKKCINKENFWWQEIEGIDSHFVKKVISEVLNLDYDDIRNFSIEAIIKCLKMEEIEIIISRCKKKYINQKVGFRNVNVEQLLEMSSSNLVTLGAHTMNHPILKNEDFTTSKNEIEDSIEELGNITGKRTKYFAYPNGIPDLDFSKREMDILHSKGIDMSFSTEFKKVTMRSHLMKVPRGEISNNKIGFELKLFLWEYWRAAIELKNGKNELIERERFTQLLNASKVTI